jgi:succinate-acetate transporter protein
VLRPVASSLPLGFLAFGVGTVLLTALELQWVPPAQGRSLMLLVFGVLLAAGACRFALTGLYQVTGGANTLETVSGWIGVPLVVFALYGGLALLLEDGAQRTVLPLGRRGRARSSLEGDLGSQIAGAEQEPGIRRQL